MPDQPAASIMAQLSGPDDQAVVQIIYRNYRGETRTRRIRPSRIWYGSAEWHTDPQWILDAWDLDKGALRSFAVQDIFRWSAQDDGDPAAERR
jgi:predicted DNA-binding transcriptional regulator YafY